VWQPCAITSDPKETKGPARDQPDSRPAGPGSAQPGPNAEKPAVPLTPEEQMALFEKELKETDWGHQPC